MSRQPGSSHLKGFPSPSASKFWPATLWEVVRKARGAAGLDREEARKHLLTLYYKPVYRFFQRVLRVSASRVEDVTQDFFTRFIEKDFLKNLRHEKSFSNFLKVACRRHYINWCEAERVRKGGSRPNVSLDEFGSSIENPLTEAHFATLFDQELRSSFLNEAMGLVRERLVAADRESTWKVFEARTRIDGGEPADYEALSKRFSMKVYDVRNRLTAARKEFREAVYEIACRHFGDARQELESMGMLKYVE
ncbi:MAG: sigma-70 family RNA polymerase sigma factor [Planctomycetota bacterium]